jgi:hypothetical protein
LGLAFGTGLLALLAGLLLLAVVLRTEGAEKASAWATVLGTVLAIAGALVTLVTWWLRQRAAARQPATSDQVTRAAQELHAAVREQWRKEAEARSLGDPDPMPVRWRLSDPDVMDHDDHIASTRLRFAGRSDRIPALTDQFLRLRRRRLVIIGAPGSGKTTLAVQLVLELLEGWRPGEPVPVLFSLASWNPQAEPRVQDWLATQLNQTYPDLRTFGTDTARRLADHGRLLPVLDGLDEIPADRRGEVIQALNASLNPDTGLILTSRTLEYTDTVHTCDVLTAAAVIQPEPMTASEIVAYLKDLLPRQPNESWQAVLTVLADGTAKALAEVLSNPLGLWLLRIVHIEGRRDPKLLIDPGRYPDAATILHHLLDELIPAAVRSRPPLPGGQASLRPKRHHDPEQVRRWLTTLATELRDAKTRDWRWWQLAHHTFAGGQITLGSGLAVGLAFGLLGTLAGATVGVPSGLVAGLMVGLVVGLVFAVFALGGDRGVPAHADFRLRGRATTLGSKLVRGLLRGLVFGLLIGLVFGLVSGLTGLITGRAVGLGRLAVLFVRGGLLGLPFGLLIGLAFGLVSFSASPSIAQRASSPAESLRGDGWLTLIATSILMLTAGFGAGMANALIIRLHGLVELLVALLRCARLGQARSLIPVGQIARASSSKAARTRRFTVPRPRVRNVRGGCSG